MKRILAITTSILFLLPLMTFGKTVKASSFGFNAKDATSCIQKAINSGAKEVIIDYTGKPYYISSTIRLRSNLTLTLEDKVLVKAAKGAFKKPRGMFSTEGAENLIIQGKGNARIEMRRKDYRNPKLYTPSEHRHILTLIGVENVIIRNLTLAESGGDGIYFGGYLKRKPYCKNILVENVRFTGHNRLGLAVISGEDVIIRNCSFDDAAGAPPQGGIDLEPNKPNERLVNILIENCTFNNNKGSGLSVAPTKLNETSLPVSVTIRNCKFTNNGHDFYLQPCHSPGSADWISAKGKVTIENCHTTKRNLLLTPSERVLFAFNNCIFDGEKDGTVFDYRAENGGKIPVGNIRFNNCVAKLPATGNIKNLFTTLYISKTLMCDKMGGTLYVEQNGTKKLYDFAPFLKKEIKRFAELYKFNAAVFNEKLLKVPAKDSLRKDNEKLFFRGGDFIQYAEKGQKITLTAVTKRTGYDKGIFYSLKTPSGKVLDKGEILPDSRKVFSFTAEETGLYHLITSSFNCVDILSSHKGSAWLMSGKGSFSLINASGYLYFQVPGDAEEFAMSLSFTQADRKGKNGKVTKSGYIRIRDGKGKIVRTIRDGNTLVHIFKRKKTAGNEIYSMELRDMIWSSTIRFLTPMQPIISSNKETFFQ